MDGLLLTDETAHSGRYNMAVDEFLLQRAASATQPVVRIYRWKEPTISLGYFQSTDISLEDRWQGCPRVRRLTGGGAILHDQELTYSVTIPVSHPLHSDPYRLYEIVHRSIIDLIREAGLETRMRSDVPFAETSEGFLCFLRRDPNDIVTDLQPEKTIKLVGSAQRRRRGTILQHGSILLRTSPLAEEIMGIADLCPHFNEQYFGAQLGRVIAASLRIQNLETQRTENFVDSDQIVVDE